MSQEEAEMVSSGLLPRHHPYCLEDYCRISVGDCSKVDSRIYGRQKTLARVKDHDGVHKQTGVPLFVDNLFENYHNRHESGHRSMANNDLSSDDSRTQCRRTCFYQHMTKTEQSISLVVNHTECGSDMSKKLSYAHEKTWRKTSLSNVCKLGR